MTFQMPFFIIYPKFRLIFIICFEIFNVLQSPPCYYRPRSTLLHNDSQEDSSSNKFTMLKGIWEINFWVFGTPYILQARPVSIRRGNVDHGTSPCEGERHNGDRVGGSSRVPRNLTGNSLSLRINLSRVARRLDEINVRLNYANLQ